MDRFTRLRSAPSVSFPVGRSRFQGGCLAAIWLLAALAIAVWAAQSVVDGLWLGAALMLLLVAAVRAWREWAKAPAGVLRWDGEHWLFTAGGKHKREAKAEPAELHVVLDLQSVLLLRSAAARRAGWRGGMWFWLARRDDPARWDALRRAAFARKGGNNMAKNPVIGQARGA